MALVLPTLPAQEPPAAAERPPNVVVIFIDDMGYADIGPFGAKAYPTPNLDRMAAEGMRFTDFVVPSAVCSASRAALLSGCYNRRVGISGALGPRAEIGLDPAETTIAEVCKQKGYATACFGKWHLGHHPKFLPLQQGFDEYFGLPYSNDMWPLHPAYVDLPPGAKKRKEGYPNLPLIEGNRVVDAEVDGDDQAQLTTWYTERAVAFIDKNKARPFFLYVPHSMVHVPLFVSEKFAGKSGKGLFADVVMEVDWSVGQILDALDTHGLREQTLVVFTADNGPWLSYGDHAGSAGPLREGKGTMFEGGCREPTLMRWPGRIPAGATCDELASTIDLLPTVAGLIGADLPARRIDGLDIRPLMFATAGARSPHASYYCYYAGGQLQAVRDRQWKLHLPHAYRTLAGKPGGKGGRPAPYQEAKIELALFDLRADVGETRDVSKEHPEVVERLLKVAEEARADLGDTLTDRKGAGARPPGRLGKDDARLDW
ncbi:MAG: sulfatase [Planctomycetota bacterium]